MSEPEDQELSIKIVDQVEEGAEHPLSKQVRRGNYVEIGIINEDLQTAAGPVVRTLWGEVLEVKRQKYRIKLAQSPAFIEDATRSIDELWIEPRHVRSVDV